MVEADDAMHFRLGNIERRGDQRNGGFVDIAETFLQRAQNRQGGAGAAPPLFDDARRQGDVPGRSARHQNLQNDAPARQFNVISGRSFKIVEDSN